MKIPFPGILEKYLNNLSKSPTTSCKGYTCTCCLQYDLHRLNQSLANEDVFHVIESASSVFITQTTVYLKVKLSVRKKAVISQLVVPTAS